MVAIESIIPDPNDLLALEPEEVAGAVLEFLLSDPNTTQHNRYNFSLEHTVRGYPQQQWPAIQRKLMEGWMWLEREGLLAPMPGQDGLWFFITGRGMQARSRTGVEAYRKSNLLPKQQLHPLIVQKVSATFLRGDYDIAVFQAFKEVEVAVREAGGLAASDIGVSLMRKAFDVNNGPLRDSSEVAGERQALSDLFAGAIGSYKNPQSHRAVSISDPTEAVEMIMLASHLLRIVDARRPNNG